MSVQGEGWAARSAQPVQVGKPAECKHIRRRIRNEIGCLLFHVSIADESTGRGLGGEVCSARAVIFVQV